MPARIAICLFDVHIKDFDDLSLLSGASLKKIEVNKDGIEAIVLLKESNNTTPEWFDIIQRFSEINRDDFFTSSSGAILFIKCKERVLGCCFGTTVANINKDNILRDFGLAIAFNRIAEKNYKGIESFTLSENPITNNRISAFPASKSNFNLDVYLETITELTGKYYSPSGSILVKGKEFYSTPAPLTLDKIFELCEILIDEYNETIKNVEFKKLTAVSKVKSKSLIEFLDNKLCERFTKKEFNVHLADYQYYENINAYSLTPKGVHYSELSINEIYNIISKGKVITLDFLKSKKIHVFNTDNQELDNWSLYKCLFTEIEIHQIGRHVLYKGNWFQIEPRYLKDLKSSISKYEIKPTILKLPKWNGATSEPEYNKLAASKINGQCWDRKLYRNPQYSGGIEFCDLLVPEYVIHVKKLYSSSSTSHLLMQAFVSAELLNSDPLIRNWIKKESIKSYKKNLFLKSNNQFKIPDVKYLIVLMAGSEKKPLHDVLPFFSLITFNMMIKRINQIGFNVEICIV